MPTKKNRRLTAEKQQLVYQEWLTRAYPELFNEHRLPMALGLFDQLSLQLPENISKTDLRTTLGWYASRIKYLHNIRTLEHRLNLDGSIASVITAEEKAAAAKKIQAVFKAKKLLAQKNQETP